jgi:hypothetical protein
MKRKSLVVFLCASAVLASSCGGWEREQRRFERIKFALEVLDAVVQNLGDKVPIFQKIRYATVIKPSVEDALEKYQAAIVQLQAYEEAGKPEDKKKAIEALRASVRGLVKSLLKASLEIGEIISKADGKKTGQIQCYEWLICDIRGLDADLAYWDE